MSLKKFKQQFVDQAPQAEMAGLNPRVVIDVMAPLFEDIAKSLKVDKLYIWTGRYDNNFVTVTFTTKDSTKKQTGIFSFVNGQDAERHPDFSRELHKVESTNIFNLLFHLLTLDGVDLLVIFNQKGRLNKNNAIERRGLLEDFQQRCLDVGIVRSPVAEKGHFGLA